MLQIGRRTFGDKSGVSAVEFALVAPVLVLLAIGSIEISCALYTDTLAASAARDVARRIATGRLTAANGPAAARVQLPLWVQSSATITVTQTTPGTVATNEITVTVAFPASKASPTTMTSYLYGNSTYQNWVTMAQEI